MKQEDFPPAHVFAHIEVVFGSPRARCARFGVCEARLLTPDEWMDYTPTPRTAKAWLIKTEEHAIQLLFPLEGLQPITRVYFFENTHFRVDAPKRLNRDILAAIGLNQCRIETGMYPLQNKGPEGLAVLFQLNDAGLTIPGIPAEKLLVQGY